MRENPANRFLFSRDNSLAALPMANIPVVPATVEKAMSRSRSSPRGPPLEELRRAYNTDPPGGAWRLDAKPSGLPTARKHRCTWPTRPTAIAIPVSVNPERRQRDAKVCNPGPWDLYRFTKA